MNTRYLDIDWLLYFWCPSTAPAPKNVLKTATEALAQTPTAAPDTFAKFTKTPTANEHNDQNSPKN